MKCVDLYEQEPEARLLAAFVSRLPNRTVVDVGAEKGAFTAEMLGAGSESIHVIEPEPQNVAELRTRFGTDSRVTIHALAAADRDGEVTLRRAVTRGGEPIAFGHTILERADTEDIAWRDSVVVPARSLGSLVASGELPERVGILKVDTEGYDFRVVSELGALKPDVVVVEHWMDLPRSLGPCPWTTEEMSATLAARGFSHFAFIAHRGEFTVLQWMDGTLPAGSYGNLVFLHERAAAGLLPDILACASSLARTVARLAQERASAADERLGVIEELKSDRDLHARAAEERLATLEDLRPRARIRPLQRLAVPRRRIAKLKRELLHLRRERE
jgi:FkbM family methyltransferase